ncbi:MAG: lysophospholipase [Candidatus Obscuribacterales bacterium]|nr:lysophospholipase [Candidatus Obscuribacterales bacterium]
MPLPLQSLPTGEKLQRDAGTTIEVVSVHGADLQMRKFLAANENAVALYLHGIEGHAEWFANTAAVLNAAGITVYAPDRRGAGLNSAERGHVDNYKILVDDLEFFLNLVAERHPGLPLFLIGNCWGAKVAAVVAAETHKWSTAGRKPRLDGLVLICPAIKTKPDLGFSQKLSIALALLSGKDALRQQIPIPLTTAMFTDNHIFLDYIERDPLRLTSASKAFYFASFVLSLKSARVAPAIKIPTLILQSDNDAIVDVPGIEAWFSKINHQEKKYKKYLGAAHSMDFDRRQFIEYARDLAQWIEKISTQSRKRGAE